MSLAEWNPGLGLASGSCNKAFRGGYHYDVVATGRPTMPVPLTKATLDAAAGDIDEAALAENGRQYIRMRLERLASQTGPTKEGARRLKPHVRLLCEQIDQWYRVRDRRTAKSLTRHALSLLLSLPG